MKLLNYVYLTIFLSGCISKASPLKTGMEGKPLPTFELLLADSLTRLNTNNISDNNPFVIFCFGPNCPYSRAQIEKLITDLPNFKDLKIYAITAWPFSEMKQFYTNYKLGNYGNIITGYDVENIFQNHYKIPGVPYTAVYDKHRKLKGAFVGNLKSEQILELLHE